MNHEIVKNGDQIIVKVSIKTRKLAREPVQSVETKDVLEILRRSGYNLKKYKVIEHGYCTNYKKESQCSSQWILELKEKEVKVAKQQPTNRKRSRRTSTNSSTTVNENQLLRDENLGGVRSQTQTDLSGQDKEISGE